MTKSPRYKPSHTQIFRRRLRSMPPNTHTHIHTCSKLSAVWGSGVRRLSLLSQGVRTFLRSPPERAGHWRSALGWEWLSSHASPPLCPPPTTSAPRSWFYHRSVKLTVPCQGQRWSGVRHAFFFKGTVHRKSQRHSLTRTPLQSRLMLKMTNENFWSVVLLHDHWVKDIKNSSFILTTHSDISFGSNRPDQSVDDRWYNWLWITVIYCHF